VQIVDWPRWRAVVSASAALFCQCIRQASANESMLTGDLVAQGQLSFHHIHDDTLRLLPLLVAVILPAIDRCPVLSQLHTDLTCSVPRPVHKMPRFFQPNCCLQTFFSLRLVLFCIFSCLFILYCK